MQTRQTTRLARKMASYRQKHSLRETAIKFGILAPDGTPSTGGVSLLLKGYEPKTEETRLRWRLSPEIKYPARRRTINDHLAHDDLTDMPSILLLYALACRK